jgi:hypothetical protein
VLVHSPIDRSTPSEAIVSLSSLPSPVIRFSLSLSRLLPIGPAAVKESTLTTPPPNQFVFPGVGHLYCSPAFSVQPWYVPFPSCFALSLSFSKLVSFDGSMTSSLGTTWDVCSSEREVSVGMEETSLAVSARIGRVRVRVRRERRCDEREEEEEEAQREEEEAREEVCRVREDILGGRERERKRRERESRSEKEFLAWES